jgi:hypothetical protein
VIAEFLQISYLVPCGNKISYAYKDIASEQNQESHPLNDESNFKELAVN